MLNMRSLSRGILLLVGLLAVARAHGAEIRSGEAVVIKADETIADDLYVVGQKITIDGTVEGDVIAFGEQITINGVVQGDLMGAAQTVVIAGSVEDARIAGQVLKLATTARLDGDLVATGFSLECEPGSTIAGDVLYGGFQAVLAGQIDQDVRGGMVNCRLAGQIDGQVNLEIGGNAGDAPPQQFGPPPPVAMPAVPGGLSIAETAVVKGKLVYLASQPADVAKGALLTGEVEHRTPPPPVPQAAGNRTLDLVVSRARHAACVAIVGLIAVLLFPRWTGAWADNIRTRPLASLLGGIVGLVGLIALFVVAIIVIVLAAILFGVATLHELVPMVIVGGIVGYLALLVLAWLLMAFLAEALAGLALGRLALKDDGLLTRVLALLAGLVVVVVLLSIPYLGPWLGWLVFVLALGGFCLWLTGFGSEPVAAEVK